MDTTNRREFLRKAAVGGASVAAGLTAGDIFSRRVFAENSSDFQRIAYREFGSTGIKVSEIGMGCMNMRNPELVHAAIDSGINFIDTAHSYMNGVNEQVVGRVMETKRNKVFLTTKLKFQNPENIPEMMGTSLKRLKTDYADLMMLHVTNSRDQILNEELMKIFDDARKKGMCRFIGVSTHANQSEVLDAAVESKLWEAVLVGYNYFSPPTVKPAIERSRKAGLAVIAMKNLLNPSTPRPWPKLEDIRKDKSKNLTSEQALIKWVLDDPYVDTTIPGITTFEQLTDDVALMGIDMSFDDRNTIYRYGEVLKGKYCCGVAGCTGCLNQCPHGVRVNDINRCLGYAYGYGNVDLALENYNELPESSRIDKCEDCTDCVVKCVNGLDLTRNIKQAKELFA